MGSSAARNRRRGHRHLLSQALRGIQQTRSHPGGAHRLCSVHDLDVTGGAGVAHGPHLCPLERPGHRGHRADRHAALSTNAQCRAVDGNGAEQTTTDYLLSTENNQETQDAGDATLLASGDAALLASGDAAIPLASEDATSLDTTKTNKDCKVHDDQKELYDFVYGDKKAEEELNILYKQEIKPCTIETDNIVDCTPHENKGDTISFCKNNVDQHFENKNLERLQQDSEEVTKDGHPIVFKYNESTRDLLDGFESFGSSFMLLKN